MTEHVDIADGERHEPKGIASATALQVYVADGAQSGTWKSVFAHAMMSSKPADSVAIATIGTTAKKLLGFTRINHAHNITANITTDEFTMAVAGDYRVSFEVSFSTVAAGDAGLYEFQIRKNDVESGFGLKREMSGSSDTGAAGAQALFDGLIVGDTISIWVLSDSGADTDDIDVEYVSMFAQLIDPA